MYMAPRADEVTCTGWLTGPGTDNRIFKERSATVGGTLVLSAYLSR